MRRAAFVIVLVVVFAGATQAFAEESFDFRSTRWGMNQAQVLASESGEPVQRFENSGGYIYDKTVAGMECYIAYVFVRNMLVRARYTFHEEHSNLNEYIVDRDKFHDLLDRKYGSSDYDETIFIANKDYYANNRGKEGRGFATGDINRRSFWQTERTDIDLFLGGDNFKIELFIEYRSRSLAGYEQAANRKPARSEF